MKAKIDRPNQSHQGRAYTGHVPITMNPPQGGSFGIENKRPETAAQRRLHALANNSPQVQQLKTLQAMANEDVQARTTVPPQNRVTVSRPVVQRMGTNTDHLKNAVLPGNKNVALIGENHDETTQWEGSCSVTAMLD